MYFQLGWRNIWRNPRRTAVITIAVVIGVWAMIFLGAMMQGLVSQMIDNGIATLTGDLQIHHKDYRSDPVVENSITKPGEVEAALKKHLPPGARWAGRVRVTAIASNARHSTGVTLVGIDPEKEAGVSFIDHAVTNGRLFDPKVRNGIVVGQALLDKFETRIGHKLVLMSQDTTKQIASRAFRIVGVYRAELEATEKQYVFVPLDLARTMLQLGPGLSEFSIALPEHQGERELAGALSAELPRDIYRVETWEELLPILRAYLKVFDGFIYIWYLVVFIAMGFGIVNTTLMAVFERMREFGLLKALGMRPVWIIREVLTESFFVLLLGMLLGNIGAFLCVWALSATGIDLSFMSQGAEFAGMSRIIYPRITVREVMVANLVVFFLGLLVSLYPAAKAARFTPIEAMAQT
ncbi:MAG: ABC transporter permease [Proteobacteria bacterium]|nr:ABC transporter permease [Pseudomonadota bacterium]